MHERDEAQVISEFMRATDGDGDSYTVEVSGSRRQNGVVDGGRKVFGGEQSLEFLHFRVLCEL